MSVGTVLAAPASLAAPATHASVQSVAAGAYDLTSGRLVGTLAALVALAGVVVGVRALARSRSRSVCGGGRGWRGAVAAVVAGLVGMVAGAVNLAVADGGLGTGNGVAGGVIALVLGSAATVVGLLALARLRRTGSTSDRPGQERALL